MHIGSVICLFNCICWCVNPKTGNIVIPRLIIKQEFSKHMTCECTSKHQTYNFTVKPKCGIYGNFAPTCFDTARLTFISKTPWKCDFKTGFYKPRICTSKGCTCQDTLTGTLLTKYHVDDYNRGQLMTCKCAMDEFHSKKKDDTYCLPNGDYGDFTCLSVRHHALNQKCSSNVFVPICDSLGKYFTKQCYSSRCFCVDPNTGKHIGHYSAVKSTPEERAMTCECAYKEFLGGKSRACNTNGNELTECQKSQRTKNFILGYYTPRCDKDGSYSPLQCHQLQCWCVSSDGVKLNYNSTHHSHNMNCRCARDESIYKNEKLKCTSVGNYESLCLENRTLAIRNSHTWVPTCRPDGSFSPVQCDKNLCYCVDPSTGLKLNHYFFDKNSSVAKYAKCDCAIKEFVTKMKRHCHINGNELTKCQKKQKTSLLVGTFTPRCEDDGTFSAKQCYITMCWCADKTGHQIGQYSSPLGGLNSDCRCARDQVENKSKALQCSSTGSYKSVKGQ